MQNVVLGLLLFALGVFIFRRILFSNFRKPKFPVRWTVTLGLHKTPEEYEKALESNGFKIGDWARKILKKVTCVQTPVEIHLGSATVAELGLPKGGTTRQLHTAILALGLQLCPSEAGPALRLLLKDQPKGE